jgi:hypothetical protein
MTRYLLGQMTEADQHALEQEFFTDSEKFDQVWAVENELVDAYVRDRLPSRERELFERHYLPSPKHRERVAFARLLLEAADETATAPVAGSAPAASWWQRLLESLRGPQMLFVGAMATAMLLLTVGVLWLLVERTRLSDQLASEQSGRVTQAQREQELSRRIQELEKQITGQRQQNEQANSELARLREELRQAQAQRPDTQSSQPALLSFLLIPGGIRAGGEMQQIKIPSGIRQAQLRVKVEANDYRSFQARLRPVDGDEILSRVALRANAQSFVTVTVPASRLASGDYILTLSGVTASGETEEINRYSFRVNRQ